MISIIQGFKLLTTNAIDNRILLSKAEMVAIKDNTMPDKYFAICKDDGCLYMYDKSREILNDETGKFVKYSASKIESITVNGVELPVDNKNVDLPLATAEKYGLVIPGTGLKSVNGVLSIDFNAIEDESIPYTKINWAGAVIEGDNI